MAFKFAEPLNDVCGLGGVGVRIGQIKFVISNRFVRVVLAPGDFAEAPGELKRVGERLLQRFVIGARGVELATVEAGQGAIEDHQRIVRFSGKHTGESGNGVIVGFELEGNVAPIKKPVRVVGCQFQLAVNDDQRIGEQAMHQISLHGSGEQIVIGGMEGDFGFEQLRSLCQVVFLKIGGGGDDVQLSFIHFGERKSFRLFERVAQHLERAVGQAGYHVNLAEREPCFQIVRLEFADTVELRKGLTIQRQWLVKITVLHENNSSLKTKTGLVKRPVGVEHSVPIAVFAKLITGGFGQVQRHAFAGAKALIEPEIDLRDEVVGIDFFSRDETRGGVCKIAGTLQLNAPEIQAARVKGSGEDGI